MEFTAGNIITIIIAIVPAIFGYGILHQKIRDISEHKKACEKRFDIIENDHDNSIKHLSSRMDSLTATLNQIAGKLDLFFNYIKRD